MWLPTQWGAGRPAWPRPAHSTLILLPWAGVVLKTPSPGQKWRQGRQETSQEHAVVPEGTESLCSRRPVSCGFQAHGSTWGVGYTCRWLVPRPPPPPPPASGHLSDMSVGTGRVLYDSVALGPGASTPPGKSQRFVTLHLHLLHQKLWGRGGGSSLCFTRLPGGSNALTVWESLCQPCVHKLTAPAPPTAPKAPRALEGVCPAGPRLLRASDIGAWKCKCQSL